MTFVPRCRPCVLAGILVAATGTLLVPVEASGAVGAESGTTTPVTGSVGGRVFFGAQTPPVRKINVSLDQSVCGAQKTSPQFVIGDGKGLANVVVRVEGVKAPAGVQPAKEISIEQKTCEYAPHVQAVYAKDGVTLTLFNRDGILHNVHGFNGDETVFNFAQPGMMEQLPAEIALDDGVVHLVCDVHEWMSAYIVLVPHPFFAVTDANGAFQIDGLPPGNYQITAWHEALGTLQKSVQIDEGGAATVDFEILPRR